MFFGRHPFVRDGLVSVALVLVWLAGTNLLCKVHAQMMCEGFRDLLETAMWPARIVTGKLVDLTLYVAKIIWLHLRGHVPDRIIDSLLLSIGIPVGLLYWFLLGGTVFMLWRLAVRTQDASAKRGTQS